MSATTKQLGVTPPLNTRPPTKAETKINEAYEKLVTAELDLFEAPEMNDKRERTLTTLREIIGQWAKDFLLKRGASKEGLTNNGAFRLVTFGSYHLDVHTSESDVDALCVFPNKISRNDFFEELKEILRNREEITHLTAIQDAYVPVMKFYFLDLPIDLLCAQLQLPLLPETLDLLDPAILKGLDEKSILSLNGCRVASQLVSLVPSVETFRSALRGIKKWARNRGIYGNVVGFLGGVSWAIMTARVCQLYPNALPGTIITRFFRIFVSWRWPDPVILAPIQYYGVLSRMVWGANPKDKLQVFPIITPAYPSMNSTYNVSEATRDILVEEFQRGVDTTLAINEGRKTWSELFSTFKFFDGFDNYVAVFCCAWNVEAHQKWQGYIESRIRNFVSSMELTEGMFCARPHTDPIEFVTPKNTQEAQNSTFPFVSSFWIGIVADNTFVRRGQTHVDLTDVVLEFLDILVAWPEKTDEMEARIDRFDKISIPAWVRKNFEKLEKVQIQAQMQPEQTLGQIDMDIGSDNEDQPQNEREKEQEQEQQHFFKYQQEQEQRLEELRLLQERELHSELLQKIEEQHPTEVLQPEHIPETVILQLRLKEKLQRMQSQQQEQQEQQEPEEKQQEQQQQAEQKQLKQQEQQTKQQAEEPVEAEAESADTPTDAKRDRRGMGARSKGKARGGKSPTKSLKGKKNAVQGQNPKKRANPTSEDNDENKKQKLK